MTLLRESPQVTLERLSRLEQVMAEEIKALMEITSRRFVQSARVFWSNLRDAALAAVVRRGESLPPVGDLRRARAGGVRAPRRKTSRRFLQDSPRRDAKRPAGFFLATGFIYPSLRDGESNLQDAALAAAGPNASGSTIWRMTDSRSTTSARL